MQIDGEQDIHTNDTVIEDMAACPAPHGPAPLHLTEREHLDRQLRDQLEASLEGRGSDRSKDSYVKTPSNRVSKQTHSGAMQQRQSRSASSRHVPNDEQTNGSGQVIGDVTTGGRRARRQAAVVPIGYEAPESVDASDNNGVRDYEERLVSSLRKLKSKDVLVSV